MFLIRIKLFSFVFFVFVLSHGALANGMTDAEMLCPETEYAPGYRNSMPVLDEEEILKLNGPLIPGGSLKCKVRFDYSTMKNNKRMRVESGEYEGVKYRIYFSDGSGAVQGLPTNNLEYPNDGSGTNWSTQCKVDKMDDKHWCYLDKADLRIGIWKDGVPYVSVGGSHYPRSDISVRIDKNKPITASEKLGFTTKQSLKIIMELKQGASITTRYQEWPYQRNIDKTIEAFGFIQAWEILQNIYKASGNN